MAPGIIDPRFFTRNFLVPNAFGQIKALCSILMASFQLGEFFKNIISPFFFSSIASWNDFLFLFYFTGPIMLSRVGVHFWMSCQRWGAVVEWCELCVLLRWQFTAKNVTLGRNICASLSKEEEEEEKKMIRSSLGIRNCGFGCHAQRPLAYPSSGIGEKINPTKVFALVFPFYKIKSKLKK